MRPTRWMVACALEHSCLPAVWHEPRVTETGHAKGHGKQGDDVDQGEYYKDRDREAICRDARAPVGGPDPMRGLARRICLDNGASEVAIRPRACIGAARHPRPPPNRAAPQRT